jgi:hypothetical protein
MADLARNYHKSLQMADLGPLNQDELEMSTEILLQEIPEGQRITNPEALAKAIISYAEVAEENGAIIVLDQEKAYDKIWHDYLWKTPGIFQPTPTLYQHHPIPLRKCVHEGRDQWDPKQTVQNHPRNTTRRPHASVS